MEKFRFENELREAVLSYEDGQSYVTVGGEKRKVRSPVPLKMDSIGENGIACLISERAGNEVEIVAVLFDDLRREEKDWICVNPRLTEQAVGFFLENHQMEKMVNNYEAVRKGKIADYVIDDICIIELGFLRASVRKETGSYVVATALFQSAESLKKSLDRIILRSEIKRVILLILLPYRGDSLLKTAIGEEIRQVLEDATAKGLTVEFWIAEMQFEADGISLLSYENVTDMLVDSGMMISESQEK